MLVFKLGQKKYSELYNAYFDYACQFIWRMTKDQDLTEEVVQVAFIKLFKSINKFREESSLKTYFTRILINAFYDEVKRKRENHVPLDEVGSEASESDISEEDIDSYIQYATPMQHACLTLFYKDGFSIPEIASIIEASDGTVKSHLSRGRATIKHYLTEKESDHD